MEWLTNEGNRNENVPKVESANPAKLIIIERPACSRCVKSKIDCKYVIVFRNRTVSVPSNTPADSTLEPASDKLRTKSSVGASDSALLTIPPCVPDDPFSDSSAESTLSARSSDDDDDTEIETLPISNTQIVSLLYHPHLDPRSRELATLNSLLMFVQHTPTNGSLIYELFPDVAPYVFSNAVGHDGLRHSILSMAAIIRDMFQARELSSLYFDQKSKCLQSLQTALSNDMIDESVITAVLGQIFTDICMGDMVVIKRHLRGLYLMYKHQQKRGKLTPVSRFVARIAARVDISIAYYFGDELAWPLFTPLDEDEDRKWMTSRTGISKNVRTKDIEWALAGFAIDNIWQQTYTFARQSHILRTTDINAEEKIYIQFQLLQQSFECWKQRGVVLDQEEMEDFTRLITVPISDDPFTRFLQYETLPIDDRYYAKLLNQWRAAFIYATLILPFPDEDVQIMHAIDICRTTAALGNEAFSGPQWECLFYAGMVLGQVEREWIIDRCKMIAARMPVLSPHVEKLNRVWSEGRGEWNSFGKVYPRKEDTWFK